MRPPQFASRRAILGTVIASGTAGCLSYIDPGPDCSSSSDRFDTDIVEQQSVSHSSNTARINGSCDRSTRTTCLVVSLHLDPAAVDVIEARRADGEVVVRKDVDESEIRFEVTAMERGEADEFTIDLIEERSTVDSILVTMEC